MIKRGVLVFSLFFSLTAGASEKLSQEDKKISYITETKGSKPDLYVKASTWFSKTFKDSKSVLEVQDKESGKLVGKGMLICDPLNKTGAISFSIDLTVKDNKFRLNFENLTMLRRDFINGVYDEDLDLFDKDIKTKEDLDKVKEKCFNSLHDSLKDSFGKSQANDDF